MLFRSETDAFTEDGVKAALGKVISAKHADMLNVNLKAIQLGADYNNAN